MLNRRLCVGLLCAGSMAISALGQAEEARKKRTLPDFDARDLASQALPTGTKAKLDERRTNLESFAAGRSGTRIVPSRTGVPKLLVRDGQMLAGPSGQAPEDIAKGFLRSNSAIFPFTSTELSSLRLINKDVTPDATFLAFNQTLDGIDVFEGHVKFTLTKAGEVVQAGSGDVMPELRLRTTARLSAEEAIQAAFRSIGRNEAITLERDPSAAAAPNSRVAFKNPGGEHFNPITAELSIFLLDVASPRLAYRIFLEADRENWYEILIDAEDARMLFRHSLYVYAAQARVWTESPLKGTRQLVTLPAGWLASDAIVTTGNNTDTYLDANGDGRPDTTTSPDMQNGRAMSASQVFDFAYGDGGTGLNPRNFQPAAVTNLFYYVNAAHDYYYGLGFTEAAGNFQNDNLGLGGVAKDPVLAEAQSGRTVNNAVFSSTPDGTSPRLRVGLDTFGTSSLTDDLDSDYDGQTVIHEYGHGVSNRLVGARTSTSCLARIHSGAMGEGWSDYFAISFYNNPVFDAYDTKNTTRGIRRQSYEGYTFTYEDIGNGSFGYEVHDDGEIWAAALWDLRTALGQTVTDKLVVAGLKGTPCNPTMTDARDAILSADQATNGGANRAKIWQVFAKHGMGFSAAGREGSIVAGVVYDAAYDQPTDLQTAKNPKITSNPLPILVGFGDAYRYGITASNPNGGALSYVLNTGPTGMSVNSSGIVSWLTAFTGGRVKVTVTDTSGGKVVHGFFPPVLTLLNAGSPIQISGTANSQGFAALSVPAGTAVLQVTLRGGTGDADISAFPSDLSIIGGSTRNGNAETLTFPNPKSGIWPVTVTGFKDYAAVTLTATFVTPAPLRINTSLNSLSGDVSSESMYRITIPTGATMLTVTANGGSGDVDLYLRRNQPAACQGSLLVSTPCFFDNASEKDGNNESIAILNPAPGDWYIDLSGFKDYLGVKLTTLVASPPTVAAGAASLAFSATQSGTPPAAQDLDIFDPSGSQFNWTARATTTSGTWLSVSPTSGTGDKTIKVSVNQSGLAAGSYDGSIIVESTGLAGSPLTIAVKLTVTAVAPAGPTVVNAASNLVGRIAPGELVVLFTTKDFGPPAITGIRLNSAGRVDTVTGETRVLFDGVAGPMIYAVAGQVSAVVPYGVAGPTVRVQVEYQGRLSSASTVQVGDASPAIFTANSSGSGPAVVINQDGSINSAGNPAARGTIVIFYETGEGKTNPAGIDGKPNGLPLPMPAQNVTVGMGDKGAEILYAGGAPDFVAGVMQVNARVPVDAAVGDKVPLTVIIGNTASPAGVTIAIK